MLIKKKFKDQSVNCFLYSRPQLIFIVIIKYVASMVVYVGKVKCAKYNLFIKRLHRIFDYNFATCVHIIAGTYTIHFWIFDSLAEFIQLILLHLSYSLINRSDN